MSFFGIAVHIEHLYRLLVFELHPVRYMRNDFLQDFKPVTQVNVEALN